MYGMRFLRVVRVSLAELADFFWLAWAMTVHSTQGLSIDAPITVHDAKLMARYDPSVLYTAITRTTRFEYLNVVETKSQWFNGVVYCVTRKRDGRRYVGSTEAKVTKDETFVTAVHARWKAHQEEAKGGTKGELYDALRADGPQAFTTAVVRRYVLPAAWPAARKQSMAEKEGFWIDRYDSIAHGFNKKSEGRRVD